MNKETLKSFRNETYNYDYLTKHHQKAIYFIDKLLENGVKIDDININDWNCNINPSVYVSSGRYSRLYKNDYKLALKRIK